MPGSKEFGSRIKSLREAKKQTNPNYTLRQFALQLGISATFLSKVERGEIPAPTDKIIKMAELLDCDSDELLALADKVDPELSDIIKEKPVEMASFLRSARGLSSEQLKRFQGYMESESREGGGGEDD
jgi:transcriptional regulator with XRE-family HTH domain